MSQSTEHPVSTHLVLDEQGALGRVGEVGSCPLHHQLEGCVRRHVLQVVLPNDRARLAVDAKELHGKHTKYFIFSIFAVTLYFLSVNELSSILAYV